jgi:hypothetical protein
MMRMVIDARCMIFLCRVSPVKRTTTDANADRLQTSRVVARLCRARAPEPDINRCANGGANADADAPPLF